MDKIKLVPIMNANILQYFCRYTPFLSCCPFFYDPKDDRFSVIRVLSYLKIRTDNNKRLYSLSIVKNRIYGDLCQIVLWQTGHELAIAGRYIFVSDIKQISNCSFCIPIRLRRYFTFW